jgi:hypothetical protein
MRITHLGHACLLVEMADVRLLIDPGAFVDDFSEAHDLDAVIVTHRHPDHLDPQRLPGIHADNPNAAVLCDPESVAAFADLGVEAREHGGATTRIGGVTITPFGEQHALIHDDLPRITNVGVRLDADGEPSFFHPGDALDAVPGQVDVLAFPLQAPWQRSRDMTAFLRRFGAPTGCSSDGVATSTWGRRRSSAAPTPASTTSPVLVQWSSAKAPDLGCRPPGIRMWVKIVAQTTVFTDDRAAPGSGCAAPRLSWCGDRVPAGSRSRARPRR